MTSGKGRPVKRIITAIESLAGRRCGRRSALRRAGLEPRAVMGLHYNPLTRTARLGGNVSVNYLVHASKPETS